MAKNDTALLQDISSQLKKLNQVSVRDKLQEREANERQEAIMMGYAAPAEAMAGGDAFVDSAEDFKRRFVASTAGMYRDIAHKPEEKLAQRVLDGTLFTKIANNTDVLKLKSQWPLYKMIDDHWKRYFAEASGSRLSDEENRREKDPTWPPGMHPNSRKNWIQPGWNADESELDPNAKPEKKTWFQKLLGYPKTAALWVVGAVGTALYHVIDGWDKGGFSGAVAGFFGGSGEGGLTSGIIGAFKGAGIGIAGGFLYGATYGALGGPVGALVGGLIGAVSFAILGAIGADKIKLWMDETGAEFKKSWNLVKEDVMGLASAIGAWIYTPGGVDTDGNAFKAKMFGGVIEWKPGKISRLSESWLKVVAKIEAAPGMFAAWLEEKVRNLFPTEVADRLFGDSPETKAKKKILATHNRNFLRMEEDAFAGSIWKSMVENQIAEKPADFVGIGSTSLGEHLKNIMEVNNALQAKNRDAKGEEIEILGGESGGFIENLLDSARETYLAIGEFRKNKQLELGDYGQMQGNIIIDDKSDKSTTTTTIINSTYIDHILGNDIGSGNNSQVYQNEDGNIYSWQP